ncbi:hypothetical protein, variant [Aphanomyces invadans]|uniref:Uncharacterized protein n=1 Tax=Aphanomyces invadans TaxID=157072 RepID=A0A024TID2_9STRA|nr:hypothetical protein, variant [Aphanomyces invadans]ETV93112.1 hypothetical protein, variant [Aphanomyces invadans]|eukprot:XP_008878376.1 hypothetical protein, variant [Aphanomyces invadans]
MSTQEAADLEANEERVEQVVVCALCCVRSRIIQLVCVALPSGVCLCIYCFSSSPRPEAALIVGLVPVSLFGLVLVCLPGLVFWSQVATDHNDAHRAHRVLKAKQQTSRIAGQVACDATDATDNQPPNTFALCLDAAKSNNVEFMVWALAKGQCPDETDHLGRTPLHWACCNGSDDVAEMLIKAGAALDLHDRLEGFTPLHYAAFYGHIKLTRLMVVNGANMESDCNKHMNPLQLAEMACLKVHTVQPSHPLVIKYVRGMRTPSGFVCAGDLAI